MCSANYPTRNKLFGHIKESGHALHVEEGAIDSGKGKKNKKKGKRWPGILTISSLEINNWRFLNGKCLLMIEDKQSFGGVLCDNLKTNQLTFKRIKG